MVCKMSPITATSSVLLIMLLLNTGAYAYLRFTTPSDEFQIDQNFVSGDIVTDQIVCDSSENNPIIRYDFVDSSEEKFAINTRNNYGILSMAMDALQLLCTPTTEDCYFSLSISCSSFGSVEAVATNSYSEINATRISVVYQLVNKFRPLFIRPISRPGYDFEVQEDYNVTANPVIATFNAMDQDLGPCGQLRYSMNINTPGYLRIDPSSGELSLLRPLDHETVSGFLFTVVVENPMCSPRLPNRVRVTVTVIDVNDEQPIFNPRTYSTSVAESEQLTPLVNLNCSDKDTPLELLRFEKLTPINSIEVDFNTGNVYAPGGLDYEEQSHYELQFKCLDLSLPESFDVANVTIDVLPINEHSPELLSGSSKSAVVNDSLPVGTLIASNVPESNALVYINARDQDEGDHGEIQFRAQWYKTAEAQYFGLDPSTGNVTLVKSLKYRYCNKQPVDNIDSITLTIFVCAPDQNKQTCPNFDIRLFVRVSGDCLPTFDKDLYNIQVNESTSVGTELYSIICNTPGIISDQPTMQLEIIPNSIRQFKILGSGGLVLQEMLDYEQEQRYAFVVQCSDKITNLQAQTSVIIDVLPSNDNHPKFSHPFYTFTLDSSSNFELPLMIGQIQASDMDSGLGGEVTYKINSSLDSQYFHIDSTGMVLLIQSPQTLSCDKIIAVAEVSDGLYRDEAMILVTTTPNAASGLDGIRINGCDGYCTAFAVSTILLVISICIHIMTCILIFCCYRKTQRDGVAKFKESVLETSKTNSMVRNGRDSHYSQVKNSVTVPCPMYSRSMTVPADSSIYHYATTERRCALDLKLPPIPTPTSTAQAYERPLRKSSGRSELADYLEMQSIGQKGRCNSDPLLSQRLAEEEVKSDMVLLEDSEGAAERKVTLLGGRDLTPERRSVDNIYDFITT